MMDTRNKRLLSTKKDIDAILSEKFGIPIEAAKANTEYIVKRLVELQKDENVFRIHLSKKLGHMYCTQNMLTVSLKRLGRFKNEKRIEVLTEKIKKVRNMVFTKSSNKKRILNSPRINRTFFRMRKTKKQLEEFQNKFYDEQTQEHN